MTAKKSPPRPRQGEKGSTDKKCLPEVSLGAVPCWGRQPHPSRIPHPALTFMQVLGKDPAATYFRSFGKSGANSKRKGADLLGFNPGALQRDNTRDSVYVLIGNATGASGKRKDGTPTDAVTDADVVEVPAVFCEWDDRPLDWQESAWRDLGLPEPSMQALSGGKSVHTYWVLDQPMPAAEWRVLQKRLLAHCEADTSICNPARVMRLPGFRYIDKATGKPAGTAELIHCSDTRYSAAEIDACLPPLVEPVSTATATSAPPPPHRSSSSSAPLPTRTLEQITAAAAYIPRRAGGEGTYDSDRNALCGCSAALAEAGSTDPDGDALTLLGDRWPDRKDAEQVLRSTTTRNAASFWAIASANGFDLKLKRPRQPQPHPPEPLVEQQQQSKVSRKRPRPKAALEAPAASDAAPLESWAALIRLLPDGWVVTEEGPSSSRLSVGELAGFLQKRQQLLRYNELTMFVEVHTRRGWCAVVDADMDSAYVLLSQKGWIIALDPITKAICHVARLHNLHPVRQYLMDLEQNDAVQAYSLDDVAPQFFRSSDPLHVAMVRKWLIGAVARAMDPGCQMDYCLVLQSRQQGIRKSTSLRELASREWFTSTVPDGDKDFLLNVHSCWIFELAELESVTGKRDAGRLKNLVSTATDMFRVPYGRTAERRPRASVFCATVNEEAFLRDETGNRRYWVVPIEGDEPLDRDGLKAARDGIWKAALAAWKAGEMPMLTRAQEALSEIQNGEFIQSDPWLAMLHAALEKNPLQWQEPFSTSAALLAAGLKTQEQITRGDENRIAPLLRQLGFEKGKQQRKDGRLVRLWRLTAPTTTVTTVTTVTTSNGRGCDTPDALQRTGSRQTSQPSQPVSSERWGGMGDGADGGADLYRPSLVLEKVVTVVTPALNSSAAKGSPVTTSGEMGCDGVVTGAEVVTPPEPAWHSIAMGLALEHPSWSPHEIALHLGPTFHQVDGRAVKQFLSPQP